MISGGKPADRWADLHCNKSLRRTVQLQNPWIPALNHCCRNRLQQTQNLASREHGQTLHQQWTREKPQALSRGGDYCAQAVMCTRNPISRRRNRCVHPCHVIYTIYANRFGDENSWGYAHHHKRSRFLQTGFDIKIQEVTEILRNSKVLLQYLRCCAFIDNLCI